MKQPAVKELNALVLLPLIHVIHDGLRSYEGAQLAKPRPCPHRREIDYYKHDTRYWRFDVLITEDGFEDVTVAVQRYRYKQCEKPVDAVLSELFYQDCLYGRPIVDLCLYHAAENLFNRVERILHTHYGLQVDRDTIQRYGVTVADEPLLLNFFSLLFGTRTAEEFREKYADELDTEHVAGLVGVGDETYPAKKGAEKALREDNARRRARGEPQKPFRTASASPVAILHSTVSPASSVATPTSSGCLQPHSPLHLTTLTTGSPMVTLPTTAHSHTMNRVSSTSCDRSSGRMSMSQPSEMPGGSKSYRTICKRYMRSCSHTKLRYSARSIRRCGTKRRSRLVARSVRTQSRAVTAVLNRHTESEFTVSRHA